MFFTVSLCGSRRVNFRVVQVENGSSNWVLGFWVVRSVPATARVAYVEGRPRRGGLSSRVEGPRLLHHASWGGSDPADLLSEFAAWRA